MRAAVLRPLSRIMAVCAVIVVTSCARQPAPAPAPPPVEIAITEPPRPEIPPPPPPPVRAELVLLGTTDVHNRLYPYDYYTRSEVGYGLARLKPIIDSVRTANSGRTYLFDSGDLLQGNPLGYVYARQLPDKPSPVLKAMNLLRYDASVIGNHEYNYGIPYLTAAVAQAKFPFISGNTFKHGTDEHAFQPYTLISHVQAPGDTILIGVTGNTPPGVHIWDKANVEGQLQFREIVSSLKPIVAELRNRGADVVVVLSHGTFAGSSYDTLATGVAPENAGARMAQEIPGIDVVFLGHSHIEIADTTINGVLFTQAGQWAQALAQARLELEREAPNQWRVISKRGSLFKPDPARADTAFLDSLRWDHERAVAYVKSVVGRASARFDAREARTRDLPIVDFINEVQRRRTGADLSTTPIFRLSSALPAGPITVSDVAGLYVYDNTLKAIRITGAQLKDYLEKSAEYFGQYGSNDPAINPNHRNYNYDILSGADYTIDLRQPIGQRITSLTFRGQPVQPTQSLTLALNNYRQTGGGGFSMLAGAPVVYDKQEGLRELLIEEIQQKGTIRPQDYALPNWRIVPEAATRAAQAALASEASAAPATSAAPAGVKRLRVLGMNDFHGHLLPEVFSWSEGREVGGAAAFAAYLNHERAGFDGPAITLDGGDVMQGTPISNLTFGRSTIDVYNRMGVDVAAIGNHDFDWTIRVLRDRMRQARFPWLSANTYTAGTQQRPSWARGTVLLDRGGVKVGVIGLSTESTPTTTKAENVRGLEFRSGAAEINHWVPELRRQGADFVIVTMHAGATCDREACRGEVIDWARDVREKPDLIIAGHTHQLVNTVANGIRIVEASNYSNRYSVTDLEKKPDGSTHVWVRAIPTTFVDQVKPDSAVAALVARYQREIGPQVNRVIAALAQPLRKVGGEYALGHLIADAQRTAAGAQVAIMNNGGIRTDLEAGPLTWSELFQLQPFANRLVKVTLTGDQLKRMLEQIVQGRQPGMHVSGITVDYDTTAAAGSRITRMQLLDGEEVRPDGTYIVSVNDFMAGGGDNMAVLTQAQRREDTGIVDLDALIDYLQKQPQPVRVSNEDRLRIVR
jgi:2',3'-cyclic-nucleotide 2'-phosphodiesterase/3'-nucleotidase/5'-nucleotidase